MNKILFAAGLALVLASCVKDNDNIKAELEKALPVIEITSLGMLNHVGPFATTDIIPFTFGGALTKAEPGTLDIAWYTGTGATTLVDSVHFHNWTEASAASNGNNSVTTTFIGTTYPNTVSYSGTMNLRMAKLPGGLKNYTLRVYVRSAAGEMASYAVSRIVTIK